MVIIALLAAVGLWAAGQGRWALFLVLLICYFD